jgi:hypothetical protein
LGETVRGDDTATKQVNQSVVPDIIGDQTIDHVLKVRNLTPAMKEILQNTVSINRWVSFHYPN